MDALVERYSRPAFEQESYSREEQQELIQTRPPLSLKFALPPVANVSYLRASDQVTATLYAFELTLL